MLRANVVGPSRTDSGRALPRRTSSSHSGAVRVLGRYEILDRLGVGGMAEVWRARARDADGQGRLVAIKRLSPELEHDRSVAAMFLDEARLAAQLQHPGIVGLEEVGRDDEGRAYMVLEYIDGHDLRWFLASAARARYWLPVELSLTVVRDLLRALAFAHHATDGDGQPLHVVHRDVSHSNVFVAKTGRVKLADFGIARARGRASQTRTGMVKGKIGYLSPEQVRAEPLDGRSDVFSAAVVLWELLTQRRMFVGETDFKTMLAVCRDARRPPSALRPGLPPEIDALVLKGVEIEREQRYDSAEAFADAISEVARALELSLGPAITTHVLEYLEQVVVPEPSRSGEREAQPATVEIDDPFSATTPHHHEDEDPSDVFARNTSDLDTTGARAALGVHGDGFDDAEPTESGLVPTDIPLASGTVRRATLAQAPLLGLRLELGRGHAQRRATSFADLLRELCAIPPGGDDDVLVDGQRVIGSAELTRLLGLDHARALAAPIDEALWLEASGLDAVELLADASLAAWSGHFVGARGASHAAIFSQGALVGMASREPADQLAVVLAAASPDPASAPLSRLVREVATRRRPLAELATPVLGLAPEAFGGLHTGLEVELTAELISFAPQSIARRPTAPLSYAHARPPLMGVVAATGLAWPEEATLESLDALGHQRVGLGPSAAPIAEALGFGRMTSPVLAAIRPGLTLDEIRQAAPRTPAAARVLLLLVGTRALELR